MKKLKLLQQIDELDYENDLLAEQIEKLENENESLKIEIECFKRIFTEEINNGVFEEYPYPYDSYVSNSSGSFYGIGRGYFGYIVKRISS